MRAYSIHYGFVQPFAVPARDAFNWCTNYDPGDLALMGEHGKRTISKITDDTLILTDTFEEKGRSTAKRKLVKIQETQLSWFSTHLTGPIRYSQFNYKIVPKGGRASMLEFEGLQVNYGTANPAKVESFARRIRREDSHAWGLLARAMESELGK